MSCVFREIIFLPINQKVSARHNGEKISSRVKNRKKNFLEHRSGKIYFCPCNEISTPQVIKAKTLFSLSVCAGARDWVVVARARIAEEEEEKKERRPDDDGERYYWRCIHFFFFFFFFVHSEEVENNHQQQQQHKQPRAKSASYYARGEEEERGEDEIMSRFEPGRVVDKRSRGARGSR